MSSWTVYAGLLCALNMISMSAHAGCLSENQRLQMLAQEKAYLVNKIPPAFKYALEEGKVKIDLQENLSKDCVALLSISVPNEDISEAKQVLEAQPAKMIMLSAQGYALPEESQNQAQFQFDPATLKARHEETLQSAGLGKLRASIELMYAFLTQHRANLSPETTNMTPWSSALRTQVTEGCVSRKSQQVCSCITAFYEKRIPAAQMEYIEYIRANPYALATGANEGFERIQSEASQHCAG